MPDRNPYLLSDLIIQNFKAFGSRQRVPLAPITLVFGANSAGKSSVIQSLLLLKQSLTPSSVTEPALVPKGELVDLGNFQEFVHMHNGRATVEISALLGPNAASIRDVSGSLRPYHIPTQPSNGVGIQFQFDPDERRTKVKSLPVYIGEADLPAFRLAPASLPRKQVNRALRTRFALTRRDLREMGDSYMQVSSIDRSHPIWGLWRHQFVNNIQPRYRDYLEFACGQLEQPEAFIATAPARFADQDEPLTREQLESIRRDAVDYVSTSLRRHARPYQTPSFIRDTFAQAKRHAVLLRHFLPDEAFPIQDPDDPASNLPRALPGRAAAYRFPDAWPDLHRLSARLGLALREVLGNAVYLGPLRAYPERHYIFRGIASSDVGTSGSHLPDILFRHPDLVCLLNSTLTDFQVPYVVRVESVRDRHIHDVFTIRLVDTKTETTVSMLDVGFGISQVLPVIVQSMLSNGSLILIEQPEIHLHPKLQSELGTLFARCIGDPWNNQFIIETHSEHLLLRLLRLIREGQLSRDSLSVIYVSRDDAGSRSKSLRIDSSGEFIDSWPEGFFEERFQEMFSSWP